MWRHRYAFADVDVLIDPHWSLPLERLDRVSYRMLYYFWDPGKMGRYFHYNGNLLRTISATERFVAQAQARDVSAGERIEEACSRLTALARDC